MVFNRHGFMIRIDGCDLAEIADIQVKPFGHPGYRLHQQFLTIGNHITDVIGQSTIGKRDILVPFKQDNLVFHLNDGVWPPLWHRQRHHRQLEFFSLRYLLHDIKFIILFQSWFYI